MTEGLIPLCHAVLTHHTSMLVTFFLAGLAGSATHCVGMCGPFVLGQVAARLDSLPLKDLSLMTRVQGAALVPYHLGRMLTYVFLGVCAAGLAAPLKSLSWFPVVASLLLAWAGVLYFLSAMSTKLPRFHWMKSLSSDVFLHRARQWFTEPLGWRGFRLGVMLGFLPCGLVYAALFVATASASLLTAGVGMAIFALGTMPALIAVGIGGRYVFSRFQSVLRYVFPLLMIVNAVTLFLIAGEIIR